MLMSLLRKVSWLFVLAIAISAITFPIVRAQTAAITNSQATDWFSANWITLLGLLGLTIGVIGVLLAIVFYYKPRKVKRPRYALSSLNLVSDFASRLDPLEINYAGERVENITVTKAAFWNDGSDTINGSDVPTADPISFGISDAFKILDSKLVYAKNPSNKINIAPVGQSAVNMNFEYLDKNDGAILRIVHTGKSSADIKIGGTIKGVGKPEAQVPEKWAERFLYIETFFLFLSTVLIVSKTAFEVGVYMVFLITVALAATAFFYLPRASKTRLPKGFEERLEAF